MFRDELRSLFPEEARAARLRQQTVLLSERQRYARGIEIASARLHRQVSIAGDLSDIAFTAAGRSGLPKGSAPKTAAVAGGSAALTAVVLAAAS